MAARNEDNPLERVAGVTGPDATAAFKLLSNETRLAILIALWEAYEPFAEENAVAFSALRERVGTADSGQFNYHLDQLTDHFVQATESGYELRTSGHQFVRAIIAGSGLGEAALSRTAVDISCNRCGASPVQVSYHHEAVHLTCSSCEGFIVAEDFPAGLIGHFGFDPAGLDSRDAGEVLIGSWLAENNRLRLLVAGVCPECSGTIETSLLVCEHHDAPNASVCSECGRRDEARARHVCTVCKYWNEGPAQSATIDHPDIISFYNEHGVDLRLHAGDLEHFQRVWTLIWEMDHAVVSTEPLAVEISVPCDGHELRLVIDENLKEIEVSHSE